MESKKGFLIAGILVILILGGWLWWNLPSAKGIKKETLEELTPEIQVSSLNLTDIDDQRIKATSQIILNNPFPIDIRTNRLNYYLYIDSVLILQDAYNRPITIASSNRTTIELPFVLLREPIGALLKYFDDHNIDSANYRLTAHFDVDVPVAGNRNFTMEFAKRLPALRLLKASIKDVDLNAFKLNKKGVNMDVEVANPNLFPVQLRDGTFTFTIKESIKLEGALNRNITIPSRGKETITLNAKVKNSNLLKLGEGLLSDKKTNFIYIFRCKAISQNEIFHNSNLTTTVHGTLEELASSVKSAQ